MSTPPNDQAGPSTVKSRGRQKVIMAKMEKKSNLQVTYSKRRTGLFKKASELCTLCGAEAAIVVFSPAEKAYCFGHPDFKTIIERFENGDNGNNYNNPNADPNMSSGSNTAALPPFSHERRTQQLIETHRNATMKELNLEYTELEGLLKEERKVSQELKETKKKGLEQHWIPPPLDGFNYDQLAILRASIVRFKEQMDDKVQKELMGITGNDNQLPPLPDVGNFNQQVFQAGVGIENPIPRNDNQLPPLPDDVGNYNQQVFQAGVGIENPNNMVFEHGGVQRDGDEIDISGLLPMLFNNNDDDDINQHLLQGRGGIENPNPSIFRDGGGVGGNVSDINNISGVFPTFNNVVQPPMMDRGSSDLIGPWPTTEFGTDAAAQYHAPLDQYQQHDPMATDFNATQYQAPLDQYQHDPMVTDFNVTQFQAPLDQYQHNAPQYEAPLDQYQHDPLAAMFGASGSGGSNMFYGDGNNNSSAAAMRPHNPNNGGNADFGPSGGFNGYDHRMF